MTKHTYFSLKFKDDLINNLDIFPVMDSGLLTIDIGTLGMNTPFYYFLGEEEASLGYQMMWFCKTIEEVKYVLQHPSEYEDDSVNYKNPLLNHTGDSMVMREEIDPKSIEIVKVNATEYTSDTMEEDYDETYFAIKVKSNFVNKDIRGHYLRFKPFYEDGLEDPQIKLSIRKYNYYFYVNQMNHEYGDCPEGIIDDEFSSDWTYNKIKKTFETPDLEEVKIGLQISPL